MIKKVKIIGINDKIDFEASFNRDVNIITGVNGCGKTSILKILWYSLSSNLERLFDELHFHELLIETGEMVLKITPNFDNDHKLLNLSVGAEIADAVFNYECAAKDYRTRIEEINRLAIDRFPTTVMFPTFRRIEGGFTLNYNETRNHRTATDTYSTQIQHGLEELSLRLGVGRHNFVTSISTKDLKQYVTNAYAEISRATNRMHTKLSERVMKIISEGTEGMSSEQKLETIKQRVNEVTEHHSKLLSPYNELAELMSRLFKHQGIRLTDSMKFGDLANAIDSDKLSSGEKQMLSFICYNAFTKNGIIFIDEPELSLHIDWQRDLLGILLKQNTSNQFIIATHSPMIYAKYEDKELRMQKKS